MLVLFQLNLLSFVFNLCSTAIFLYMNTNITNARKVSKMFMTKSIHFNQCMKQFNHLALLAMLYSCKWEGGGALWMAVKLVSRLGSVQG
jgi:hypothetical protein